MRVRGNSLCLQLFSRLRKTTTTERRYTYHQEGCHCTVSWPCGHLSSFQSGHLLSPGFFLICRNELQLFLESQIQQKVPEKAKGIPWVDIPWSHLCRMWQTCTTNKNKWTTETNPSTWMSASETPKSRLETRSFPPVSTPAPPAGPLKPLKPLSYMSCCHFSGSCLGCNRWKRTHLLTSGSPCLCHSQSTRLGVGASRGSTSNRARVLSSTPPRGSPKCSLPTPSLQASEPIQTDIHRKNYWTTTGICFTSLI